MLQVFCISNSGDFGKKYMHYPTHVNMVNQMHNKKYVASHACMVSGLYPINLEELFDRLARSISR